ncbi:uncharacterized protein PFL1_00895 [Pseudozyma flocculosa PF-1]|uniref:Translation initiation factor 3 N-terminal domain-containing protein n=1 Tax=Pseudozyma flocculosa TaxID=84751 RepID=A0A5C3F4M6_9BASI|nr:uncharacterized protein PFL1_00895 [Pseudozyma flocculosa PF-1]EPQ31562.1 hypothetical protein PFL1_00895 [Pseudozyma flocculosa PF-1]SPO38647.1 uncharacterized protein PSFLO_04126 [Pseudozyma flocculosa]
MLASTPLAATARSALRRGSGAAAGRQPLLLASAAPTLSPIRAGAATQPGTRYASNRPSGSASPSSSRSSKISHPAFRSGNRATPSSSTATSSDRSADDDADGSEPKPGDLPPRKGPLRDEEIARRAKHVRLVDPKTGSLAGPFPVLEILAKLDRSRYRIEQVVAAVRPADDASPPPPPPPPGDSTRTVAEMKEYPICKLIDKKEDFNRQRDLKRKQKANEASSPSAAGQKEVQLTWTVAGNDLSHKLSKARKELLKGSRINVVITAKSGSKRYVLGRDAAEDEKRASLLRSVEDFLCDGEELDQAADAPAADAAAAVDDAEPAAGHARGPPVGRRTGEVVWQRGGSAVVSFERIDRGK